MMRLVFFISMVFLIQTTFASETIKGAKKDLDQFKHEMSVELEKMEKNLKVMSEKAEKKSDTVYKDTLKEMTIKRDKLRVELNTLEADAKGKWKDAKTNISSSLNSLNERIQKALKD